MPIVNLQPVKDAFASAGHKINPNNWSPKARQIALIALGAIAAAGLAAAIVFPMPILMIGAFVVSTVFAGSVVANISLQKRLDAEFIAKAVEANRFRLAMLAMIGVNIALIPSFAGKV